MGHDGVAGVDLVGQGAQVATGERLAEAKLVKLERVGATPEEVGQPREHVGEALELVHPSKGCHGVESFTVFVAPSHATESPAASATVLIGA